MMKNILLPTDFSQNSRNAAAYALQFFRDTPCTFHLLHVIPVPTNKLSTTYLTPSPNVQEKFDELLDWLHSIRTNPKHKFTISFTANFLIEAVRTQVLEKNIDLILMGTKGATNKEGTVVGKNTSDVMMKVRCPILAISENAVFKRPEQLLFPTDYKVPYEGKLLNTLYKMVNRSEASVKVLELFTEGEPSQEQKNNKLLLQSFFAPYEPSLQTYYPQKKIDAEKIFNDNSNSDMIVLAAKNLNICQKLLRNHKSDHIPFIRQLPLLVLH